MKPVSLINPDCVFHLINSVEDTFCYQPKPEVRNGMISAACRAKAMSPLGHKCNVTCHQGYQLKDASKNYIECGPGNRWVDEAMCSEYRSQDDIFLTVMSQSDTETGATGPSGAPAPSLATTRASPLQEHGQGRDTATTPARTGEMAARSWTVASPWRPKNVLLLDAVSH